MTNSNTVPRPHIRAAALLIENERILLVKQEVTAIRHWSLPGGKLEFGETLEQCLIRELKEETGLDIKVKELIYVTDRIIGRDHIVHMSFLVEKKDDSAFPLEWKQVDPFPSASCDTIREIRMVPIYELNIYGFSSKWCQLVKDNFPGRGGYKGNYQTFYGEQ